MALKVEIGSDCLDFAFLGGERPATFAGMIRLFLSAMLFALFAAPVFAQDDDLPPLPTRAEVLAEIEAGLTIDASDLPYERPYADFPWRYRQVLGIVDFPEDEVPMRAAVESWITTTEIILRQPDILEYDLSEYYLVLDTLESYFMMASALQGSPHAAMLAEPFEPVRQHVDDVIAQLEMSDDRARSDSGYLSGLVSSIYLALGHPELGREYLDQFILQDASTSSNGCQDPQRGFVYLGFGEDSKALRFIRTAMNCLVDAGEFDARHLIAMVNTLAIHNPPGAISLLRQSEELLPSDSARAREWRTLAQIFATNDDLNSARIAFDTAWIHFTNHPEDYRFDTMGQLAVLASILQNRCVNYREMEMYVRAEMAAAAVEVRLEQLASPPDEDSIIVGGPGATQSIAGLLFRAELNCGSAYQAVSLYQDFLSDYGATFGTHGMSGGIPAIMYFRTLEHLPTQQRIHLLDALNRLDALARDDSGSSIDDVNSNILEEFIIRALAAREPMSPYDAAQTARELYALARVNRAEYFHSYIEGLAWLALALPE